MLHSKKIKKIQWFLTCLIVFATASIVCAQEQEALIPGPKGVAISAFQFYEYPELAKDKWGFPSPEQKIIVSKSAMGKEKFKQVTSLNFPASAMGMNSRLDQDSRKIITDRLGTTDMGKVYDLIRKYGADTLGMTLAIPEIQVALGLLYIDSTWKKGDKVTYRFERVDAVTGAKKVLQTVDIDGQYKSYNLDFKLDKHHISDSTAMASFVATVKPGTDLPNRGYLYLSENNKDTFTVADSNYINRISPDSVTIAFLRSTVPGSQWSCYVRSIDIAGNMSAPSDTLHGISYRKEQVLPIENLTVTDTLKALLLRWKPLPKIALYSSVQILKSRQTDRDFVLVATVSPRDTAYLDENVISGTNYYYKVRPATVPIQGLRELQYRDAMGYKAYEEGLLPAAPQGLNVQPGEKGIELTWLPNPDLNLFGFFVLRGTTLKNLQVVAGPVKEHQFVDTAIAAGYNGQYVYALQVMDQAQNMSDTSAAMAISVRQPAVIFSPNNLQARREAGEAVYLRWENTRSKDNTIVGYMIYRRKQGEDAFEPLNDRMVMRPDYTDSSALSLNHYEYAVTSIDTWGNQSVLSPLATVRAVDNHLLRAPDAVSLRSTSEGIEISWPKLLENGGKSYGIYRKEINGSFQRITIANPSQGSYIDKDAVKGRLYQYAVSVIYNEAESDKSEPLFIRK